MIQKFKIKNAKNISIQIKLEKLGSLAFFLTKTCVAGSDAV